MKRLAILALLLWPTTAYADCVVYPTGASSGGVRRYLRHTVCDTQAERPMGQAPGDTSFTKDNSKSWVWTSSYVWADMGQSGGGTAWGGITGTLASQTDLQTALNGKEPAGTFSGIGACASSQWARTLNDGAAPTCAQPAFSDLSGAATDAQVPDTITIANITQVTARAISDTTGTLALARGGTGATSLTGSRCVRVNAGGTALEAAAADCASGPVIARKAADQSSTSTTFANVTGLTFAVAASTTYSIECNVSYLTAATTTALQVSLNGPASPTAVRFTVWTATSATASHNASQNAYDAVTNPASALTTALPVRLVGTVENGVNAGTLALRMRTEVSGSSVTVQRGSWCALF